MKKITNKDGEVIEVEDEYVLQEGETEVEEEVKTPPMVEPMPPEAPAVDED